jgi:antirestriction protein ArdC
MKTATATKTSKTKANRPGIETGNLSPIYSYVTDKMLTMIENGVAPWSKGFFSMYPLHINAVSGNAYQGTNVLMLEMVKQIKEYKSPIWLTFNQVNQLKGKVIKGEKHPTFVIFFTIVDRRTDKEKEQCKNSAWRNANFETYRQLMKKRYSVLKYSNVFNIEQTDLEMSAVNKKGLELLAKNQEKKTSIEPIQAAQERFDQWTNKPAIKFMGNQPAYEPAKDTIYMPPFEQWKTPERFYKTLFHESGHASGHPSRLNRPGVAMYITGNQKDGTTRREKYSFEELIAELTAAYTLADLGIETPETEENSASYLKGWIEPLKNNPQWIVKAASQAWKATEYIKNNFTPEEETDE